MKVLIIDDEENIRFLLCNFLKKFESELQIVGTCDNGCGMSPAQLQYVHSLLAANITSKVISEESPRTGIGLVNVK